MGIKVVIADVVEFPVKFTLNDAGRLRSFNFRLVARRTSGPALLEFVARHRSTALEDSLHEVCALLREVVTDWRGQTLVVDEDTGVPAAFSADGFDLMLSLMGVAGEILAGYTAACSERGREKN